MYARNSLGGTSSSQTKAQIKTLHAWLKKRLK
jgi:hypothetical protein